MEALAVLTAQAFYLFGLGRGCAGGLVIKEIRVAVVCIAVGGISLQDGQVKGSAEFWVPRVD